MEWEDFLIKVGRIAMLISQVHGDAFGDRESISQDFNAILRLAVGQEELKVTDRQLGELLSQIRKMN